jgi:hypothetical protein
LFLSADEPYQFYVGVNTQTNNYTALTKQMLLVYLGDHVQNVTEGSCKDKVCSHLDIKLYYNKNIESYCTYLHICVAITLEISFAYNIVSPKLLKGMG